MFIIISFLYFTKQSTVQKSIIISKMAPYEVDDMSVDEDNQKSIGDDTINLLVQSNSEYEMYDNSEQDIYINGNLKAPACPNDTRKPIDIVVVLDRSGSMYGAKLKLCLKTIKFLIREMSSHDRLSIVTYDTYVHLDLPLTKMDRKGKALVEKILPGISTGSQTNLSGGLLQGIQEIQSEKRLDGGSPNPVKSILLLTDGLANIGITSTKEMIQILQGTLHKDVTLFTFGYGPDHNVDMLRQMSEASRGMYYFVKDIDGVSLAFADCLGGLLSVVAQNIKLDVKAINGCEIVSFKTKKEINTIKEKEHYEVEVGDIYAEEERDVLVIIKLPQVKGDRKAGFDVIQCTITYANVLSSSLVRKVSQLTIGRFDDLPSPRVPNSHVLCQKHRILTAETIDEAIKAADIGKIQHGRTFLGSAIEQMTTTVELFSMEEDKECIQDLMQDLKTCEASMASAHAYKSGGQQCMSAKAQAHYMQRSNYTALLEEEEEADGGAMKFPVKERKMAYRGSVKTAMVKRAKKFF